MAKTKTAAATATTLSIGNRVGFTGFRSDLDLRVEQLGTVVAISRRGLIRVAFDGAKTAWVAPQTLTLIGGSL